METFEEVCEYLDIDINEITIYYPNCVFKSEDVLKAIQKESAFTKLSLITEAFNSKLIPNWEKSNNFFFQSKEDASYCGKQFFRFI